MSEDTKQSETQDDQHRMLRLYYRRLRLIAFITLIVSGIWCLIPFWKAFLFGWFGFYWLFIATNDPVLSPILLFLLAGISLFCLGHLLGSSYPEEVKQHHTTINELRADTIGLGIVIGLALVFKLAMVSFLLDLVIMENVSSVATEQHIYHLSHYTLSGFSDGEPYGLIECDIFDIACKQTKQIIMRWSSAGPEQPALEYDDRSGRLFIFVKDIDEKHPTLKYDEATHMLYMEGNGQTYYSVQLEE